MIVGAWFLFVAIVIIAGFTLVGLTFRHWAQEKKALRQSENSEQKPISP